MRMLASAVIPATAQIMLLHIKYINIRFLRRYCPHGCWESYSFRMYSFSAEVSCSNSLLVTFLSAAKTIPSFARMPKAVPACEIASKAYSTW